MEYVKIKYNNTNYYLDIADDSKIYDVKFNLISEKKVKELNFSSIKQFHNFLKKIRPEEKKEYLDEIYFKEILSENILVQNIPLAGEYLTPLLKSVNYKIIKRGDLNTILECMDKIISKNKNLSYNYLSITLDKKIKIDKNLRTHKYFKEPYAKIVGETFYGLPLIFSKQMDLLRKSI